MLGDRRPAEIVQPCLRNACASTSSSHVSIRLGPFELAAVRQREPRGALFLRSTDTPTRTPLVGKFSEQVWGVSASVLTDTDTRHAANVALDVLLVLHGVSKSDWSALTPRDPDAAFIAERATQPEARCDCGCALCVVYW